MENYDYYITLATRTYSMDAALEAADACYLELWSALQNRADVSDDAFMAFMDEGDALRDAVYDRADINGHIYDDDGVAEDRLIFFLDFIEEIHEFYFKR